VNTRIDPGITAFSVTNNINSMFTKVVISSKYYTIRLLAARTTSLSPLPTFAFPNVKAARSEIHAM
jgi:hypothetical protein